MESYWPENSPTTDRKRLIESELLRGREFTNQLQNILLGSNNKPLIQDELESAEDLISRILGSFNESLSRLNSGESDEVSQIPAKRSLCWDGGLKSEDSGESSKSSTLKDRRGCYKRRRTSQSWATVTSTLIDDGHAWRKYGQKVILNAKHPRNYFRCTHKHDQGCQATKQVQKTEEEPPRFRITYNGHHTCKNMLKSPQIILDSNPGDSSILLSFQTNTSAAAEKQDNHLFPPFALIKQEYKDDIASDDHDMTHNHPSSSSSDYLLSPDLMTFDSSEPRTGISSTLGSDYGDVISGINSCSASTHSLDIGQFDFDDFIASI
nr:WRKY [Loropetalum chinense var. rubrum]WGV38232.1 WRKY [Loropetalum chinense var. rubrum]